MKITSITLCPACKAVGKENYLITDTNEPGVQFCDAGHRSVAAPEKPAAAFDEAVSESSSHATQPTVVETSNEIPARPAPAVELPPPPASAPAVEKTDVLGAAEAPGGDLLVTVRLAERHKGPLYSEAENTQRSPADVLSESLNAVLDSGFYK